MNKTHGVRYFQQVGPLSGISAPQSVTLGQMSLRNNFRLHLGMVEELAACEWQS
ncbi:hypothetical protein MHH28_00940 [Paenibacillus sp. FSL K6-1217]|uniref:hypothetical protein n=1 Tax=Paenibacillus sp. FSL K6-1217 TaxID=2921466 RepID=UPI003249BCF8